jgi:hypothetical protein
VSGDDSPRGLASLGAVAQRAMLPGGRGLQEIVDALSVRLGRPVLVDDLELRPLAYSSQTGELDFVRTASILGRHAPETARDALFAHGIRTAPEAVRIPAHPEIPMSARVCIPIVRAGRRLGFLWLLEDPPVGPEDLRLARSAASEAATVLQSDADARLDRQRREQELIVKLLGPDAARAEEAAATLEAENYLPLRPLVVSVASTVSDDGLDRVRLRASAKHALAGEIGGRAVCIVGTSSPLRGAALADVLRGEEGERVAVGEGDEVADVRDAARSYRRALAALRVASATDSPGVARWLEMRAARLLTALPETALDDVPAGLRQLLDGGHDQLVLTLETYLDHAGDVKSTSAALWLHRTSLYYRLRRIEELAGVDLSRGEDRLLCHIALRLARLNA